MVQIRVRICKTPEDSWIASADFLTDQGTYFRYDFATNEFGIINQYGGISTYFCPDEGSSYWYDQVARYAG